MKILDSKDLTNAFINGSVQLEKHELVPWFLIEEDSVLIDGEEEVKIVGNIYTERLMGNWYVKMDSTHRNEVVNNDLSGGEPTMTAEMRLERQKLWAEQFPLVTVEEIAKLRGYEAMTPEQYRMVKIKEYMAKQDETYIEFEAEVKGQVLKFGVGSQKKHEMQFQLMLMEKDPSKTLTLHDLEFKNGEDFNAEETQIIIGAMMQATLIKEFTEGAFIKRLLSLPDGFTKEDVEIAATPPLTEEEQAWVYSEVARKLG